MHECENAIEFNYLINQIQACTVNAFDLLVLSAYNK